jgi:hypothetical protein
MYQYNQFEMRIFFVILLPAPQSFHWFLYVIRTSDVYLVTEILTFALS